MAPPTATETVTEAITTEAAKLSLRSNPAPAAAPAPPVVLGPQAEEDYKYAHLLPIFDPSEKYPPLEPFEHIDPGHRALTHENPLSFITDRKAAVVELTPNIGTEITGVNLLELSNTERDQLALEVARRGVVVFRNQEQVSQLVARCRG